MILFCYVICMNVSKPPVFAQVILGSPNQWIVYCQSCNEEFGNPVLDRESLSEVILVHSKTHTE